MLLYVMCLDVLKFNPLSPKSEHHLFSPNNINTQSGENVVRIIKIIT